MNANKPTPPAGSAFTGRFTQRIANHPRVAYYLHPICAAPVLFVLDELLVAHDALATVTGALGALVTDTQNTVFGESPVQPPNDIHILRLTGTPGNQAFADVAMAVWTARTALVAAGKDPAHVSPNHVLVAAPNYHSCPFGPPSEPVTLPQDLGHPVGSVRVVVIDSGYETGGVMDERAEARYGKWFTAKNDEPTGYGWVDESAAPNGVDAFDQDGDGRLDALVGHANFVAGVVAQACPTATLEVVSHNGAFVNSDDADTPIPTEASVALSLWEVLHEERLPSVINIGFAFPTLPAAMPGADVADGPPSYTFSVALDSINDRPATVIVAPAGNQDCTVPQYPAAFFGTYDNVFGVGSLSVEGGRSDFSNHGPWVACCTRGENVDSAFVTAKNARPEEAAAGTKAIDFDGWASWSGTSFAAPRVAGAIARVADDTKVNPLAAWNDLIAGHPSPGALEMGVYLPELGP